MLRIFSFLFLTVFFTPTLFAEPFWGSKASQPINTPAYKLKAGHFIWQDDVPTGTLAATINLSKQQMYVYRGDILIGVSTVSTGAKRRRTPRGNFTVLEKQRYHRSRKYNNALMPYMQRLTHKGIAIHAGRLPGYPASHGCIRLPTQFARLIFQASSVGMPVTIL